MEAERLYLDWNAAAPLCAESQAAMAAAMALAGNPSSVHGEGRAARRVIEQARAQVAAGCGAPPAGVIFTSGGTEANVQALGPHWTHAPEAPFARLLVSAVEHPSVLAGGRFAGAQMEVVPVGGDGLVDLGALDAMLRNGPPALVAIQLANNETGVIQPIREIAARVHQYGGVLHVDAVQALGKIAVDVRRLNADTLSLSAHKIGGPKGVGALVLADPMRAPSTLLRGGGQERGQRAGTENVIGIAGFGAAAARIDPFPEIDARHMADLRDRLEAGLIAITPDAVVVGAGGPRLPNTLLVALARLRAETAIIAFDLAGIAVSSGAACSSGKVQPSHVLRAMGLDGQLAQGAIRFSLGPGMREPAASRALEKCLETWRTLTATLNNPDV